MDVSHPPELFDDCSIVNAVDVEPQDSALPAAGKSGRKLRVDLIDRRGIESKQGEGGLLRSGVTDAPKRLRILFHSLS